MNENADDKDENALQAGRGGHDARHWLVVVVVAIALVAVATAAILLVDDEPGADYPAGSAEAAFGAWARAWESGDAETAWEGLSTRAQERTSPDAFRAANRRRSELARRIWIDEVITDDERTVLYLSVETFVDEGLLGSGRDRKDARVTMSFEEDVWRVDTPTIAYHW
jgi:hypothetical protein